MNTYLSLGKWLFAVPILGAGVFHFLYTDFFLSNMPGYLSGLSFLPYVTGVLDILCILALATGKYEKLAMVLLSIWLLFLTFAVHLPVALSEDSARFMNSAVLVTATMALAGGALMYAKYIARDNSWVG